MLRKPHVISIFFIIAVFALVSAATISNSKVGILSKTSHAEKLWKTSGHAEKHAEAFTHWDEDGEIPTSCAKCHSTPGFQDFIADGVVNSPAPIGTSVECEACHSDPDRGIVRDHTSVVFPSGVEVENLGPEALCMECHQGRASTNTVNDAVAAAALADDDTVSPSLRFINIHYFAAAANQFGTVAKGGYEYAGKSYDARFSHVKGYNACIACHNPHSLEVDLDRCNTCHTGVKDPKNIRFYGSFVDYDGDGDMTEGIYYEIQGFKDRLYTAIQSYAREVVGSPIVYNAHAYPYFFYDKNDNGVADPNESIYPNRYLSFTPRLLRAAYNYQVAQKDPAGFAHGGKYIIELLYDSIEDLNAKLPFPVSMAGMSRVDEGHFDGSAEAWRHWDEDGEVSSRCARCHSSEGLPYFLEHGENVAEETANGLLCTTCHTSPPSVRRVSAVTFPSGAVKDMGDSSNICMICHQGRASRFTVAEAVKSPGPYTFINIHYYPVGAVLFGSEVHGGFEFEGKIYAGRTLFPQHMGKFDTCVECHMGTKSEREPYDYTGELHNVHKPDPEDCVYCHGQDVSQPNPGADPTKFKFSGIRPAAIPDYDGDGNSSESIKDEIKGLEEALYAQIQTYAANIIGAPIVYDPHSYPYFFYDLNANGDVDPGENIYPNRYASFNARLLKAAYNYQMSKKEPHGFIHNSRYIAQLLVDSIENIRGDISRYTWR
ncbi:MAG: multiheme c-type cytochrome [Candidatus Aminicenantales bacterium]